MSILEGNPALLLQGWDLQPKIFQIQQTVPKKVPFKDFTT